MLILGITDGISCGAAIVRDGEIVAAVNEEALCRMKMAFGFPRRAIAEVMRLADVQPENIDRVISATVNNNFYDGLKAWDGWLRTDRGAKREALARIAGNLGWLYDVPGVDTAYYRMRRGAFRKRRETIRRIISEEYGLSHEVEFVEHHLAHATSAYFTSGFTDAVAVTMDGGGDGCSSHVYVVRDGYFEEVARTAAFHSLGNYYSYVTAVCGFTPQKHEGKITGLAAQGDPVHVPMLDEMITLRNGRLRNDGRAAFQAGQRLLDRRLPKGWRREDLAASIQTHCESLSTRYIAEQLERIPDAPRDLALAGGLFANVRINQKIAEIPAVRQLFVHPGMSDAGLGVGAALTACVNNDSGQRMTPRAAPIRNVYLGADYSVDEIEAELKASGLEYSRSDQPERRIAELLRDGYVVARFHGRMEYGPRALGNRSILYHPADRSVNDWLNTLLKRTEFMPYAPSTLMEDADRCYRNVDLARDSARFMTVTFECTEWMKRACPGVVHIDGTARPQLVRAEDNPSYHALISAFRDLTGVGTVINTSFNMHEEPIVYSPADAIRAFRQGHLDYLAIGDFLVPSPEPIRHELRPMPQDAAAVA